MTNLEQATCVYHPGKVATSKCKQCGQSTCAQCTVTGPTGKFCSTPCRTAHESRVLQAKDIDGKARSSFFVHLRGLTGKLIILIAIVAVTAWVATVIYIPVLSELVIRGRAIIGF